PVEMDESLFCKHFKGEVVGITGTRGKTTTSTMIYEILSRHCGRVFLAGNIMGRASLPLLEEATEADTVVLELSSWQLQGFHDAKISPRASVFTNIYPDHLNRYNSMVEYVNDKKAIFLYQGEGDFCVFNGDQSETRTLAQEAPAGTGFFAASDVPDSWRIRIPGAHNGANVAAALCLSRRLEIPEKVIREATEDFSGVEHRLQWLGEYRGIGFVNDSTSTTPVAGSAALSAMQGRRILLIAGGSDKNLDMTDYGRDASVTTARIALLEGSATPKLEDALVKAGGREKIVGRFDNLKAAVYRLVLEAQPGDLILFSPACASFGMFQNEFHRGETFISIVRELFEDDPHGVARDNEP
ncbi:MAG: UDP-N-acetylmuramoyl-L-alanine--D-glutamate ligase, partial [Deltaproteobacteria bacterium]|nr:UDP-N-acetylmuramoyl-L-alanine--D-glutamate ligase [Deltaproteobacteria bacterium]